MIWFPENKKLYFVHICITLHISFIAKLWTSHVSNQTICKPMKFITTEKISPQLNGWIWESNSQIRKNVLSYTDSFHLCRFDFPFIYQFYSMMNTLVKPTCWNPADLFIFKSFHQHFKNFYWFQKRYDFAICLQSMYFTTKRACRFFFYFCWTLHTIRSKLVNAQKAMQKKRKKLQKFYRRHCTLLVMIDFCPV